MSAWLTGPDEALALVRGDGERWTLGRLRQAVAEVTLPERGPVVVCTSDAATLIAHGLAAWEAGRLFVPLDPTLPKARRDEIRARLRSADLPDNAALGLCTSGSTAQERVVLLGRQGIEANVSAILDYLPLGPEDRLALPLPLTHGYGWVGCVLTALRAGAGLVLLGELPHVGDQVALMRSAQATALASVPAGLRRLADAAEGPIEGLRWVASAGAPMERADALVAAFPGARRFDQYGLTEASPRVGWASDAEPDFGSGRMRPLAGLRVSAVHVDGRAGSPDAPAPLVVQGPSVMLGYLDEPVAQARVLGPSGLRTGDLGWIEDDGRFCVAGREDNVVKVAGERVDVGAVGRRIAAAPGVRDAAVVDVPDAVRGRALVAVVVGEGADGVRLWARTHLRPAERPKRVVQAEVLPRTASGKLDSRALRALVQEMP